MEMTNEIGSRLKRAWNAFLNNDRTYSYRDIGASSSIRPDRSRLTRGNERSIVTAVYNRIAIDCASIDMRHVYLDANKRYKGDVKSKLNTCLTVSANVDQTGRAFMLDIVMSLLDEGNVAIVPIDTEADPNVVDSFDVESLRTGRVVEWYPRDVKVNVYNDRTGQREDVIFSKKAVAIVENPFYAIMNEYNSTMQRLIRKLNLLDAIDEQSGSGKLDMIIQLPYVIKTEARKKQAEERRRSIEEQLMGSKYGIAYTDGSEKVTQLNRPVENNLMKQIEYLTSMVYSQLGITQTVLDGTADEKTMLNYNSRTVEPILSAIRDAMYRTFLTKTARTQGQSIMFFRDPFKLVSVSDLAEISDKMTRNEIMAPNEIRQIIGIAPSNDPAADELKNRNIRKGNESPTPIDSTQNLSVLSPGEYDAAMSNYDQLNKQLDEVEASLDSPEITHYASKYYDPVKAHEYYMRTRELKGQNKVPAESLNDDGKAAREYVRKNIDDEFKSKFEDTRKSTKEQLKRMSSETGKKIEAVQKDTQDKIDQLKNILESLDDDERRLKAGQFRRVIERLRERNGNQKMQLISSHHTESQAIVDKHNGAQERLRKEYEDTFDREMNAILSDEGFHKKHK